MGNLCACHHLQELDLSCNNMNAEAAKLLGDGLHLLRKTGSLSHGLRSIRLHVNPLGLGDQSTVGRDGTIGSSMTHQSDSSEASKDATTSTWNRSMDGLTSLLQFVEGRRQFGLSEVNETAIVQSLAQGAWRGKGARAVTGAEVEEKVIEKWRDHGDLTLTNPSIKLAVPVDKITRCLSHGYQNVVLLLSGSFCPPHRMHEECLEIARRCMHNMVDDENGKQMRVVGGYLAPLPDDDIAHKFGAIAQEHLALSLQERVALCRLAVHTSAAAEWIHVLDCTDRQRFRKEEIETMFLSWQSKLPLFPGDVKCYSVYGADVVISRGRLADNSVCVPRAGYEEKLQQFLEAHLPGEADKCIICSVDGRGREVVSSSGIRKHIEANDWDGLAAAALLEPSVMKYLEKKWAASSD